LATLRTTVHWCYGSRGICAPVLQRGVFLCLQHWSAGHSAAKQRSAPALNTIRQQNRSGTPVTEESKPKLYQDKRTGQLVKQVGGGGNAEEFVMVMGADKVPYHAFLSRLIPCDEHGKPDYDGLPADAEQPDELPPAPVIPVVETRLNINTASAEDLHRCVPGLGYRTAKAVKDLQTTLPGEVFRSLDQVRAASKRINWDVIFRKNLLYIN
jgi:DNA uptake protein ComE-like DNA-binding protein